MRLGGLVAHQEVRRQQPRKRAVRRIDADHRMQMQTAFVAIVAQAGGVLDRQHVAPLHPFQQMRPRGSHHLRRRHPRVLQAALAGPVAAQRAQTYPALAETQQPRQNEGPPFPSRRSPNRPRLAIVANRPLLRGYTEPNLATDCTRISFRTYVRTVGIAMLIQQKSTHEILTFVAP